MFITVRRTILGAVFGTIAGILIGPLTGLILGIIFGIGVTIFKGGPNFLIGGLLALLMVTTAPITGAFTGLLLEVQKKQLSPLGIGAVIGGLVELVRFFIGDLPSANLWMLLIIGATTGALVAIVVRRRLQKELQTEDSSPKNFKDYLKSLAEGYERSQLWSWMGFCVFFIVLSFFLMPILTGFFRQMWSWVTAFIGIVGIYFGILLAIKQES